MSVSAILGVFVALGAVLALLVVALRVLKRFAPHAAGGRGRLPMEVVQRLAVGPRQSIAVVRVGDRVLAVAIGADGMQPLAELDGEDRATVLGASQAPTPFASSPDALRGVSAARAYAGCGCSDAAKMRTMRTPKCSPSTTTSPSANFRSPT